MDPDTETLRQLKMADPTLSPPASSGLRTADLACEGFGEPDPSGNGIYTIPSSDGGGLTRLTNAAGVDDIPLDYSPDGKHIVFGRFDVPNRPASANSALFVVDVDGSRVRRITTWGFADNQASWSPEGTKIVFEHLGSPFVVHPDGTGLAKIALAIGSRPLAGDFAWSPGGNKIVFLLFTRTGPRSFQQGIATANADGSNVERVTSSPTFDHQADWGPHPLIP